MRSFLTLGHIISTILSLISLRTNPSDFPLLIPFQSCNRFLEKSPPTHLFYRHNHSMRVRCPGMLHPKPQTQTPNPKPKPKTQTQLELVLFYQTQPRPNSEDYTILTIGYGQTYWRHHFRNYLVLALTHAVGNSWPNISECLRQQPRMEAPLQSLWPLQGPAMDSR